MYQVKTKYVKDSLNFQFRLVVPASKASLLDSYVVFFPVSPLCPAFISVVEYIRMLIIHKQGTC